MTELYGALKIQLKIQLKTPAAVAECRLHKTPRHNHVVKVVEAFTTLYFQCIIVEKCMKTLWAPKTPMPSLPPHLAKKVLILHRDLKPQSILLTVKGAKIADLGLGMEQVKKPRKWGTGTSI
ncbi:hypothetical protein BGW39_006284 [Mortierella sp. 14UC]|nr:hypothetical protein BGW39_006284 [Mortierella sp. 14UC]